MPTIDYRFDIPPNQGSSSETLDYRGLDWNMLTCKNLTEVEIDHLLIKMGDTYVYIKDLPTGLNGELYKVHRFVLDVPAYQPKVLVEALTGKDKGLWFVCSINNFAIRYRRQLTSSVDGEGR